MSRERREAEDRARDLERELHLKQAGKKPCERCNGIGTIREDNLAMLCEECGGTGEVDRRARPAAS